jgi:saccharopine dehydrogenase (NAD+, L-lysine-forming)
MGGEMMKVVQLGCGVCGLVCAEHLARYAKVDRLVLADSRTDGARSLRDRLGMDKVSVEDVDGRDSDAVRGLLRDSDVVVATMPWRMNRLVMEAAADTGTDYVDFGMPFDSTGPDFDRYSETCRRAGISALVGMGSEPGISDVFAMHAATKLDRADEAHIYDGDTATVDGIDMFSLWSPVDLLDETSVPAAVLRDGRIEFIPPLSAKQVYGFPDPVGPLPVYSTNHDETYFMPMGIPTLKEASFNIGIDDKITHASKVFREWGLLSKEPVDVKGVKVRPLDVVAAMLPPPAGFSDRVRGDCCFVVDVLGEKDGKKTLVKVWTMISHEQAYRLHGTNGGAYFVGTGGAVATELLIDGLVKEKGIVIPEQLPTEEFMERLATKGIDIKEESITL